MPLPGWTSPITGHAVRRLLNPNDKCKYLAGSVHFLLRLK